MRIDLDNPHGESETVAAESITAIDRSEDGLALCLTHATVYLSNEELISLLAKTVTTNYDAFRQGYAYAALIEPNDPGHRDACPYVPGDVAHSWHAGRLAFVRHGSGKGRAQLHELLDKLIKDKT